MKVPGLVRRTLDIGNVLRSMQEQLATVESHSHSLQEKVIQLESRAQELQRKLEFVEGQNRRQFFSTSTYVGDHTAITWLTSGQRIFVDTRDLGIAQHLMFKGFWEKTTNEALVSLLREDSVFVDVGAHYGYHTITAAHRVERGRVIAVEPNPRLFELLGRSVRVNQLRERTTLHHCAVSDRSGSISFVTPVDDPALGHVSSDGEDEASPRAEVDVRALDELLADVTSIDVMKVDVEGHEWQVLHGAEQILRRHDLALVLEYAPAHIERQQPLAEFNEYLQSLGFAHVDRIDKGKLTPTSYDVLHEDRSLRNLVFRKRA